MTGLACELAYRGMIRRRPPKAELHVDVVVRATDPAVRWALLPTVVSHAPVGAVPRAVTSLDVYVLGGDRGRVTVACTIATEGVVAIPLPSDGSTVTLRALPLAWWGDTPQRVDVEVLGARELLLDGRPLADRVQRPLEADPGADVQAEALAGQSTVVESIGGMGAPAMELALVDGAGMTVPLVLAEPR